MAPTLIVRSAFPGDLYEGFKVDECWSCPAPWEDSPLYWDKHWKRLHPRVSKSAARHQWEPIGEI